MRWRHKSFLLVLAAVLLSILALIVTTRVTRQWRDESLKRLHEQAVAVSAEEPFLSALEPELREVLGVVPRPESGTDAETEAMTLFSRLVAEYNRGAGSEFWLAASELWRERLTGEWTSQDWELASQFAHRHEELLDGIAGLTELPGPVYPIRHPVHVDVELPHVKICRDLACLLAVRARVQSHEGRTGSAASTVMAIMRLAGVVDADALAVSCLCSTAIIDVGFECLQSAVQPGSLAEAETCELNRLLTSVGGRHGLVRSLVGESAMFANTYQDVRGGANAVGGWTGMMHTRPLWRPLLYADEAACLEATRQLIVLAGQPYADARPALGKLKQDLEQHTGPNRALTRAMVPALVELTLALARARAATDLAWVGLLIELHQSRFGEPPESLAFLNADCERPLPDDPFTGEPFVYRREGDGFLLYSAADNQIDDGGIHDWRTGDLVWRPTVDGP